MDMQTIILGVVIMTVLTIIIVAYSTFKEKKDLKKAENGEDMAKLRAALLKLLPADQFWNVLYAHWEKKEYKGRTTRTYYYTYGVAFGEGGLYIAPLRFDIDDDMEVSSPVLISRDVLGITKVKPVKDKNGELVSVEVELIGKDGTELAHLVADRDNTREDRYHPFNIVQGNECRLFAHFMEELAGQVTTENAGLEEELNQREVSQKGRRALILGILGIVFSFFFPIIGIPLGVIGMMTAPKPSRTGGRPGAPLIVSALAILAGIFVVVLVMTI